jgi:hypothetical protein
MRNGLLALGFAVAIPCWVCAQNAQDITERRIQYPSPDGRFAFLFTRPPEGRNTIDLIERDSGKILHRIVESEEAFTDRVDANVSWTSDSKAFAFSYTRNQRDSKIAVFSQSRGVFHRVTLPKLPRAELPANSGEGKFTDVDATHTLRWEKDGSLVAEIETKKTRADDVMIATRTVVLGFDQHGEAKILKTEMTQTGTKEKD